MSAYISVIEWTLNSTIEKTYLHNFLLQGLPNPNKMTSQVLHSKDHMLGHSRYIVENGVAVQRLKK